MSDFRRSVIASRRAWLAMRRVARDLQHLPPRDHRQVRSAPMTPLALVGSTPVPNWMAERVAFQLHLRNCVPAASSAAAPQFAGPHKTSDVHSAGHAIADVCSALQISLEDLREASGAVLKPEQAKQEQPRRWGAHQPTVPGSAGSYPMPRTA